jgi:hypothetical protein
MAWSSAAAVADTWTGRRLVLSSLVLIGPVCVLFTGRWLRTAAAGAWAICLVAVLGIPDGIWDTGLERFLIALAVVVAASSTLALVITVRTGLSLMVTASLAAGCSSTTSSSQRPAPAAPPPVSCREQYQSWKRGPALAQDRMQAAVNAVQAAEQSGNVTATRSALGKLVPTALAAAQAPPPRCADPAGLFSDYVTAVYVAGDSARSAKGMRGLLKAAAPLKSLKELESRLAAEANRATCATC